MRAFSLFFTLILGIQICYSQGGENYDLVYTNHGTDNPSIILKNHVLPLEITIESSDKNSILNYQVDESFFALYDSMFYPIKGNGDYDVKIKDSTNFEISIPFRIAEDIFDKVKIYPRRKKEKLVLVEGGRFFKGCPSSDDSCYENERPGYYDSVKSFYIDKFEVTNQEYANFLNDVGKQNVYQWIHLEDKQLGPGAQILKKNYRFVPKYGYEKHPVTSVLYEGAKAYAAYYNLRLPTESEWEYASKGGNKSQSYLYSGSNNISEVANFKKTETQEHNTMPIGSFKPNELGIYDMSGNALEITSTVYRPYPGAIFKVADRKRIVLKGGSYFTPKYNCTTRGRIPTEYYESYSAGFRCVREISKIGGNLFNRTTKIKEKKIERKYGNSGSSIKRSFTQMNYIQGGMFEMGALYVKDSNSNSIPLHLVRVSDFRIDRYCVTNGQYADFLNAYCENDIQLNNDSGFKLIEPDTNQLRKNDSLWIAVSGFKDKAVFNVSWYGANEFAKFYGMRLPTEAEYEFASKGGRLSQRSNKLRGGPKIGVPWSPGNINGRHYIEYKLSRIGGLSPGSNEEKVIGEWVSDWYNSNYSKLGEIDNPAGPISGTEKVFRQVRKENQNFRASRRSENPAFIPKKLGDPKSLFYSEDSKIVFRCVKDID